MKALFTIDVEDYFHTVEGKYVPKRKQWDDLPSRVEKNTSRLLDILDEYNVKATCFVLGYIAKRHPKLVKQISSRGHEIASHGMYHKHVYEMTRQEFDLDARDSKALLEDISGMAVQGYRSPSFSHTKDTPWLMEVLCEKGFKYDSSVFPAARFDGGFKIENLNPHWINTDCGNIFEFPISVTPVLGKNICFFGGGYLRLFPQWLILEMVQNLKKTSQTPLFYIHPREIDPDHPRFKMPPLKYFRSYVNLNTVENKLHAILSRNSFVTCQEYLQEYSKNDVGLSKQPQTMQFFDQYAGGFDSIYGSKQNAFWKFINEHFRKVMLLRFKEVLKACVPDSNKSALDVGCGPGHYMVALAQQGLGHVHGLDFAPSMIEIAKEHTDKAGVSDKCSFEVGDFLGFEEVKTFNYVILMGFMDYMEDPKPIISKALSLASEKAVFSFPKSSGLLAWQRKLRYKFKCPLYLYDEIQVHKLFNNFPGWKYHITDCQRDFFVTMEKS
ncbi:MAG: DUF3473 domain-containing protein [Candidatus Cloacimonetes bacterium]|nr:DUF3473 domain-containing protein [Candidatus Cloacimonadota bacterium]